MNDIKKILVIDDEPVNLELISAYLAKAGYEFICAQDAQKGQQVLVDKRDEIDVILLDRMMPGMDGLTFLKYLKSEPNFSHIPVIMQTAAAAKEQVVEGIEAGAYYYLTKPFDEDTLMAILDSVIKELGKREVKEAELKENVTMLSSLKEGHFELRTLGEAQNLTNFLAHLFPDPERVSYGIYQMIENGIIAGNLAIDYNHKGILLSENRLNEEVEERLRSPQYKNRLVRVVYKRFDDRLEVTFTDEGEGFDWRPFMEVDPNRATDSYGRGIALAKMSSFDDVEYTAPGNKVTCTLKLSDF